MAVQNCNSLSNTANLFIDPNVFYILLSLRPADTIFSTTLWIIFNYLDEYIRRRRALGSLQKKELTGYMLTSNMHSFCIIGGLGLSLVWDENYLKKRWSHQTFIKNSSILLHQLVFWGLLSCEILTTRSLRLGMGLVKIFHLFPCQFDCCGCQNCQWGLNGLRLGTCANRSVNWVWETLRITYYYSWSYGTWDVSNTG